VSDGAAARGSARVAKGPKRGSGRAQASKRVKKSAGKAACGGSGAGMFGGNDADDDEELPSGFKFDWDSYHAAFGDTPMEDAVTIMFAEYAELYARIAGWTTSSAPAPMSIEEGEAIKTQASNFVLNIMSPILGFVHTSKVHKLLAHTLDSIRYHGHLRQGNTSTNEAAHKVDKKFYRRTNMGIDNFTGQLVRQAQGAREIVRRTDAADAQARLTCPLVPKPAKRRAAAATGGGPAPGDGSAPAAHGGGEGRVVGRAAPAQGGGGAAAACARGQAAVHGGGAPAATHGADALTDDGATAAGSGLAPAPATTNQHAPATDAVEKPRRRSADYLSRRTIGVLSQRPGLAELGTLFKLPPTRRVPVLSTVEFTAEFNCGATTKQLLRASPQFCDERPWYDAILFAVDKPAGPVHMGSSPSVGSGSDDAHSRAADPREELHVGEVRAIIRCRDDDFAVVCDMDAVDPVPRCPFWRRDCDRLKWAVSSNGGSAIRAVPLSKVRRILHVVPDFKDLAARKGLAAAPAGYRSPAADQHAMRYFVNEFYPWA